MLPTVILHTRLLANRSIIDLLDNQFLFRNNTITDSKFNTKGVLKGRIEHNKFLDWKLNLGINTNRLLVLNTEDSEDAAYYGTAFIDGRQISLESYQTELYERYKEKFDEK